MVSSLDADHGDPRHPPASFCSRCLIFVWFLVARPGATSSIQPSSEINGRHTYQAQTLETGVNTHTMPQSALCTPCAKRFFAQQLCTHNADIGAPEDY